MRPLEYIFTHCCICIICYENRKSNLFPAIMKKGHNFPIFFCRHEATKSYDGSKSYMEVWRVWKRKKKEEKNLVKNPPNFSLPPTAHCVKNPIFVQKFNLHFFQELNLKIFCQFNLSKFFFFLNWIFGQKIDFWHVSQKI